MTLVSKAPVGRLDSHVWMDFHNEAFNHWLSRKTSKGGYSPIFTTFSQVISEFCWFLIRHGPNDVCRVLRRSFFENITELGVSINGGTPIAGWFIREYPIRMDDDWGYPYDETETPIWVQSQPYSMIRATTNWDVQPRRENNPKYSVMARLRALHGMKHLLKLRL